MEMPLFCHRHSCRLDPPRFLLPLWLLALSLVCLILRVVSSVSDCGWASVTLCVVMTGCLQGGPLFCLQISVCLQVWRVSITPCPSLLCPLCVRLYRYQFLPVTGLTSICPWFCPQQWQTGGQQHRFLLVGRHQEFPPPFCFSSFASPAHPSVMTLLASERSLLIRNKFRTGERMEPASITLA